MELAVYEHEAAVEETHWWFVGRRKLFSRELSRLGLSEHSRILDIGTGTGANLRLLRQIGMHRVVGLDESDTAIRFCAARGLGAVQQGDIRRLPFEDGTFDLVLATDVIEHVEEDAQAIAEIRRVLAPGGYALVTVPAFASLWGLQDDQSHHRRRYRRAEFRDLLLRAGFDIRRSYYFNYLLFPAIWGARRIIKWLKPDLESENQVNTPLINRILGWIFSLDVRTAPLVRPPFGVSILAICRRPA
ncbi:MAG TPA: class I SAM-dependent methyltransferase [Alphaproteobacteria bacterium]|nr:class I SAM-dependent methyltransferase [Alphaproteobacteria bacterium]